MSITVKQHPSHKNIVMWYFDADYSIADFYHAAEDSAHIMNEIQVPYYIIADLSESKHIPSGSVSAFRSTHRRASEFYQGTILVGAQNFTHGLVDMLDRMNIAHNMYSYANTIDDAIVLVQERLSAKNG